MMGLKLLLVLCLGGVALTQDVTVKLPLGTVKGLKRSTIKGTSFYSFQGIPYSEKPVGDLRFQAPVAKKKWDGTWDATKEGRICNQMTFKSPEQSEDCLFVNIFTPNISASLPVMFYIYGGGFIEGFSSEVKVGPHFLMEEDVILVSFNYRVGPYGFLSTGDDLVPGNAGLKDQNLALKWVNQYISYFGGDPTKITIIGQSAGSASCAYQIMSPLSKGLFRAAILYSGTSLSPWAYQRNHKMWSRNLIKLMDPANYEKYNTSQNIYEYLKQAPAELINDASLALQKKLAVKLSRSFGNIVVRQPLYIFTANKNDTFLTYRWMIEVGSTESTNLTSVIKHWNSAYFEKLRAEYPDGAERYLQKISILGLDPFSVNRTTISYDPSDFPPDFDPNSSKQLYQGHFFAPVYEHEHEGAFLTKRAYEAMEEGDFNKVPVLLGADSEEAYFYMSYPEALDEVSRRFTESNDSVPDDMHVVDENRGKVKYEIMKFYTSGGQYADNPRKVVTLMSDHVFVKSVLKFAEFLIMHSHNPYLYQFSYKGVLAGKTNQSEIGFSDKVAHGEELRYIFSRNYPASNTTDLTKFPKQDQLVQKRFIRLMTNFAKYLNPTPEKDEVLRNIIWPKTDSDFTYLDIGSDMEVKKHLKYEMYTFWNKLYAQYGVRPFDTY